MFQRAFSMLWVKCQGSNFTKLYVLIYIQGCDHNKDSGELNLVQNMWKLLCQDCSNRLGPLKKNISLCIFSPSWNVSLLKLPAVIWDLSLSNVAKGIDLSVTKTLIFSPASCKNVIDALAAAGSMFGEELFTWDWWWSNKTKIIHLRDEYAPWIN